METRKYNANDDVKYLSFQKNVFRITFRQKYIKIRKLQIIRKEKCKLIVFCFFECFYINLK